MTSRSIIPLVFFILLINCDATRDNIYDPKNPDRAYVVGHIYEPDEFTVEGAEINLILNDDTVIIDTSDTEGSFALREIIPDVYRISVTAPRYYAKCETYSESLWAETYYDYYDIYFDTYVFDDDQLGTTTPYAFDTVCGSWYIMADHQQPLEHSVPNVYNCVEDDLSDCAIALYRTEAEHFYFATKLKILSLSDPGWKTGIVFRYQDTLNHYLLSISKDTLELKTIRNNIIEYVKYTVKSFSKDTWYSLGIDCQSTYMQVFLNNERIFTVIDHTYKDGMLGLWVSNTDSGMTTSVSYDDVIIQLR